MRVSKISFKGFRGINDQEFELSKNQSTVLIGVNGSGKTSILECLAILLSQFFSLITNSKRASKLSFADTDITEGVKETLLTIEAIFEGENISWGIQKERLKSKQIFINEETILKETKAFVDFEKYPSIENIMKNVPFAVFYPTNRNVNQIFSKIKPNNNLIYEQLKVFENALENSIDFTHFFNWFKKREDYENEKRLDEDESFRDSELQAVRNAVENFLPNFSNLRIRRKKDTANLVVSKNGTELILNQLSHGEKTMLAMVGDLARRLAIANPSFNTPLEGKGIVLIDEIELHLHPKWQRSIIPNLEKTFPNCQFIIATHSPQVVSHAVRGSVFLIDNGEIRLIENSYGRDSNWILETIMDAPERPEEIQEKLNRYFVLIAENKLEEAAKLREKLDQLIGNDEPELTKADILIHRKTLLANEKNHQK